MRYYMQESDGYILAIGSGSGGTEITEERYKHLLSVIRACPNLEGKSYTLRSDLTWEEYDLPTEPEPSDDDELTDDEALSILLGGNV